MEQDKLEPGNPKSSFGPMVVFIAVMVSLIVCVQILQHWKAFDWWSKFLAIVLLLSILPWRVSRGERRWLVKPDAPTPMEAYIWVMIATVLFSH